MSDDKILIPTDLFDDPEINDTTIAVYCCLDSLLWQAPKERLIDHDNIMYELYGSLDIGGSTRRKLSAAMNILIENGYIAAEEIASRKYVVSPASFKMAGQRCYAGYLSDVINLVRAEKIHIIKFYFQLLSTRDYGLEINGRTSVIGYMPQTYLAELSETTVRTVSNYMNELEELGIIYVWRPGYKGKNNHYCHISDKDILIKMTNGEYPVFKSANHKRSLMQKYNAIRSGKEYPPEEYAEVAEYIRQYNANIRRKQEMFPDDDYLSLIREELV